MGPLVLYITLTLLQAGFVIGAKNVPQFRDYSALDSRYLSEDFKVGGTVGVIDAYDPDGTSIEYFINGPGANYFSINRKDGTVTLKKELEFDIDAEFREIKMEIKVTDEDLQTSVVSGKVFVQDANDLKPDFDNDAIFKELPENTPPGQFVAVIGVTDRDTKNDILSVECLGTSEAFADACDKFSLTFVPSDISNKAWKGELRLAKALDFESRKSYAILLNAKDGKFNRTNEVHIEVQDINDSPPTWTSIRPVTVREEVGTTTALTQVFAKDGDENNVRDIFYEIITTSYADGAKFSINNSTGEIFNAGRLDYDNEDHKKGQAYEIKVKAREIITKNPTVLGNDPVTTSTTVVSITLRDIDDNTPTFDKKEYTAFIPENIATGGNVPGLQMTITDIDSGTLNSFDLIELDYQDVFAIIPGKGKSNAGATLFIKDSEKIDFEKGPREYVINLEARENQASPALTGSAKVTIKVTDVNDESPRFSQETYTRTVSETANADFLVIDLDAVDDEAGNLGTAGIRYKLFGNQQNHFKIDEITGAITVSKCSTPGLFPCIDFERKQQYILTVSATDNLGSIDRGRTRSVQVIVQIIDENDNIPKPQQRYVAYIYEMKTTPVQPLIIKAEDPDTVGKPISYRMGTPAPANWQITETKDENGDDVANITARRPVLFSDAQDPNAGSLSFEVVSSDTKTTVTSQVTIFIIDINNNNPIFSLDDYQQSIFENTTGDTFVISVSASDGDAPTTGNGLVDFFITDGAQGKFTVKSSRKEGDKFVADIYTNPDATFNYDADNKYVMTLTARDQGTPESKRGQATLTVNIIDINNKSPQITPTSVSITVDENRSPTSIVHEVKAIDPDKTAKLVYYMTPSRAQNPSGAIVNKNNYDYTQLFTIERNTGIVRVNKPLNREETSFMVMDLRVEDVAATPVQTGTGALFITITEVNDQDPAFDLPLYNITIDEELNINYFVRNLHCSDEDDQISRYILTQTFPRSPNYFTLLDSSGSLIVADRIDFEKLEEIRLKATCFDDGTPQRSGTTDVLINVSNINDNSPEFAKKLYSAQVPENDDGSDIGGTLLTTVSASDIDKGDFGIVRFKMADDSAKDFTIDPISGEIRVKPGTVFDREKASSKGFQVVAYDSPNTPSKRKETSVPVYLTIIDINDNCPIFGQKFYSGSIPESAKTGTDTIDVLATDKDYGENRLIAFTVQAGSFDPPEGANFFNIGRKSGRIITQTTLTGKSGVYRFNVTATDTDAKKPAVMCSTHVPLEVTVSQSQNYAPRWIRPPNRDHIIYILESQYEGMLVYDSKAEDLDPGLSGIVDYYFVAGDEHVPATKEFRINTVTGIIRAEIEFDRETQPQYFLTLVAKDQGATRASSETTLIVKILDVDDNDPVFETKNGKVVPLVLPENEIKEDVIPIGPGVKAGQCNATDADLDKTIFYEILTADDYVRDLVRVDRDTCEIFLTGKVDYEKTPQLEFSIFAFNPRNDDKVRRHKREINPSILPVVIKITDVNDNFPKFDKSEYFACAPLTSPFRSSIIDLDAHDLEQDDTELKYSLVGTSDFEIDQQGIIHNKISFPSTQTRVFSFQAQVSDGENLSLTKVNIFVTSDSTQAMITVDRPSSDVRRVQAEYEEIVMETFNDVRFACADVKNHINDDGSVSATKADIFMAAVGEDGSGYKLFSGSQLYNYLSDDRSSKREKYQALFVSDISTVEDDEFNLDEDVVLAILIVSILLISFAILLFILACYCIWAKKKKKVRKVKAQRHTLVQNTADTKVESFENPVYHNSGYVAYEDEYSSVKREARPVNPVAIPVPENLQPLTTFRPTNLEPADADEIPPEIPEPSEPVIETEVMPADEPESPPPLPPAYQPEYEDPRIETVVEDEIGSNSDDSDDDSLPLPDPPVHADDIETEIQITPPSTPEPPSY